MRPVCEVADVLRSVGNSIEGIGLNTHQLRTLSAISVCRTPALGGHVDECGLQKLIAHLCNRILKIEIFATEQINEKKQVIIITTSTR